MTERDYDEALNAEFETQIQSKAFGLNHLLSIQDSDCAYHDKH